MKKLPILPIALGLGVLGVILLARGGGAAPLPPAPPRPGPMPGPQPSPPSDRTASLLAQFNEIMLQAQIDPTVIDIGRVQMLHDQLFAAGRTEEADRLNSLARSIEMQRGRF